MRTYRAAAALLVAAVLAGCASTIEPGATASVGEPTAAAGSGLDLGQPGAGAVTGTASAATGSTKGSSAPTDDAVGTGGGGGTASGPSRPVATGPDRGGTAALLPTTGPGWDAKHVYIGVPTADNFNSSIAKFGANFNNGSTEGDINALVADINRSGGLLGRQVVAVYKDLDAVSVAANPSTAAQSTCTYFTQDRPVIAVINSAPQFDALPAFHRCLEHRDVSLFSTTNTDYDNSDYAQLGPHLWTVSSLSTDVIAPSLITALDRQRFFTGWNTQLGRPGPAPVKVGILEPDTAQGHHVAQRLAAALARVKVAVASQFFYSPNGSGGQSSSEVLRFASAGVTHVLDLPPVEADILFFQEAADRQHYHPRYGLTSFDLPLSVQQNPTLAPPDQQIGSLGIGWQPDNDVDAAHDPGRLPGSRRCLRALSRGGQTFNSSQRRAAFIAVGFCDAVYLLRDAALAARSFTPSALLTGIPLAGPGLLTAGTFRSALSATNHGLPGYYRYLQYRASCSCFAYVGGNHRFSG